MNSTDKTTDKVFELQAHSIHSDGLLGPAEVVAAAAAAGVQILSLTDHDSVEGVAEALAAGSRHGIRVVPGTEISVLDPAGQDIHICGYLIDPTDKPLLERLARSRGDRHNRAKRIVARLAELGFETDRSVLEERVAAGKTVGRPHIAAAVFDHPANRERLAAEGHKDSTAFLVAYLIEGAPAFVGRDAPSAEEAIALIHGAGGQAVWAHPFWDVKDPDEALATLDRFLAAGVDGVEAFYPTFDAEQTKFLTDAAAARGLLTTGSSDFHGPGHPHFSRFRAFELFGITPNLGPIAAAV